MILSSENKHFHGVFARPFVYSISIFEDPACEKPNLCGASNIFLLFASYSHGTFLHAKQQEEQPMGNFLQRVPEYREESS